MTARSRLLLQESFSKKKSYINYCSEKVVRFAFVQKRDPKQYLLRPWNDLHLYGFLFYRRFVLKLYSISSPHPELCSPSCPDIVNILITLRSDLFFRRLSSNSIEAGLTLHVDNVW